MAQNLDMKIVHSIRLLQDILGTLKLEKYMNLIFQTAHNYWG